MSCIPGPTAPGGRPNGIVGGRLRLLVPGSSLHHLVLALRTLPF
jgi:hypothetical protein